MASGLRVFTRSPEVDRNAQPWLGPHRRVRALGVCKQGAVAALRGRRSAAKSSSPKTSVVPTVKVATAKGWPAGAKPVAAEGTSVAAFALGLEHPRWLYVLPNGDVLVAETNAPPRPEDAKGIKGKFFKHYQKKAGGAAPSANRITLLRDTDGDGRSGDTLHLHRRAERAVRHDAGRQYVLRGECRLAGQVPYSPGQTQISAAPVKVADLPGGPINHHWTKNVIANADGSKLYVAVGSNSNVAENGIEGRGRARRGLGDRRPPRARIACLRPVSGIPSAWRGSRRPVRLWVAVNERDELGSDLVPDYMTSVRDGGFYGWPYSYYGQHVDERVKPPRPDLVAKAIPPDYALGPHTASLGLAWASATSLPPRFEHGMFVGQHGSWNRQPRSGYKVIFVPFAGGHPSGELIDVLTGFLTPRG